jgi:prepilin-type N-terminal cleavage/methylation domain-containing protein
MTRRRERGFTLIELMVALVVSSLLAGMILAIFSRMSTAYRGQQQIAGVQQVLAAARATIELDAKQAGLAMAQGFKLAGAPGVEQSPIQVTNSSTGPDRIAFFYADPTDQAVVASVVGTWNVTPAVIVDSATGFLPGDLVVLSTADLPLANPIGFTDANLAKYDACVLQIVTPGGIVGTTVTFSTIAPWGVAGSAHCTEPPAGKTTMMYRFVAHAYRIDPDPLRTELGPLQWSLTGGLIGTAADNWTDLAYGFTDLQTALQVFDNDGADTADLDGDGNREWYSGGMQDTITGPASPLTSSASLLQVSISLVARTDRDVEGIATAATPQLIDPAIPDNNQIGDHPSVVLPWTIDPSIPGRIYRYTTFQVDLRNLGVGR